MDIKQTASARAALTLGKDMSFRDYAQGAWRMRGIGQGQTIALMVVPEIKKLMFTQCQLGLGKPQPAPEDPVPVVEDAQLLIDVAAWLNINSVRSEQLQFNLLCEQSISNVWRKRAHNTLLGAHQLLVGGAVHACMFAPSTVCSHLCTVEHVAHHLVSPCTRVNVHTSAARWDPQRRMV
jgi:hypothetical protein